MYDERKNPVALSLLDLTIGGNIVNQDFYCIFSNIANFIRALVKCFPNNNGLRKNFIKGGLSESERRSTLNFQLFLNFSNSLRKSIATEKTLIHSVRCSGTVTQYPLLHQPFLRAVTLHSFSDLVTG